MRTATVLQLRMNDHALRSRIAQLARDSTNIVIVKHARARMRKRHILFTQIQQVLLRGNVLEPAHQDVHGSWKCTLGLTVAGDAIKVAAALGEDENRNKVIVITVMN